MCRANGTLLLVDTVCSLGGVPLYADEWKVDAIYSGSQKCLSAPPGAAPLMLNDRALAKVREGGECGCGCEGGRGCWWRCCGRLVGGGAAVQAQRSCTGQGVGGTG